MTLQSSTFDITKMGLMDCLFFHVLCTVIHGRRRHDGDRYESASMMSSDIETTSYQDSSDDQSR